MSMSIRKQSFTMNEKMEIKIAAQKSGSTYKHPGGPLKGCLLPYLSV